MQVSSLSCTDLAVRAEFAMPEGTTFRDEGGASRHPDGTKFAAVGACVKEIRVPCPMVLTGANC